MVTAAEASVPAVQPENPDQVQTVPCDLSPIVKTFYGPVESKSNAFQHAEMDDKNEPESLLTAKTRRLDSFADPPEVAQPDSSESKLEASAAGGEEADGEEIEPRNLDSVFDAEARP